MVIVLGLMCNKGQRKLGVAKGPQYLEAQNFKPSYISFENSMGYQISYDRNKDIVDELVLNIGGDHSIGLSTVAASVEKFGHKLKVIWVDAHTDINTTETSSSGNTHGMPLSPLFGLMEPWINTTAQLTPDQVVYVGIRSVDPEEKKIVENLGVKIYSAEDVKKYGITSVLNEILNTLSQEDTVFHLSFDVDAIDPSFVPSTGTIEPEGLSDEDGLEIVSRMVKTGKLKCMDLVEFNPEIGTEDEIKKTGDFCQKLLDLVL